MGSLGMHSLIKSVLHRFWDSHKLLHEEPFFKHGTKQGFCSRVGASEVIFLLPIKPVSWHPGMERAFTATPEQLRMF